MSFDHRSLIYKPDKLYSYIYILERRANHKLNFNNSRKLNDLLIKLRKKVFSNSASGVHRKEVKEFALPPLKRKNWYPIDKSYGIIIGTILRVSL